MTTVICVPIHFRKEKQSNNNNNKKKNPQIFPACLELDITYGLKLQLSKVTNQLRQVVKWWMEDARCGL